MATKRITTATKNDFSLNDNNTYTFAQNKDFFELTDFFQK